MGGYASLAGCRVNIHPPCAVVMVRVTLGRLWQAGEFGRAGLACRLVYRGPALDDRVLCPRCRLLPRVALVARAATRRSRTCGPSWRKLRDCGRNCGRVRPRPGSCGTGWPGWSGSSRVTAATPRCRRRGMTPRGASRPASGAARRSGRTRRSASGASSPARRGRRCAGRSRATPVITTRKAPARAVRTWPARPPGGGPVVPAAGGPRAVRAADPV